MTPVVLAASQSVLEQQHHGGVQQHGGFVEHVLQGHQACAGAQRQHGLVQVVQLHRHRTGTQRDYVAKGAAPAHIQPCHSLNCGRRLRMITHATHPSSSG